MNCVFKQMYPKPKQTFPPYTSVTLGKVTVKVTFWNGNVKHWSYFLMCLNLKKNTVSGNMLLKFLYPKPQMATNNSYLNTFFLILKRKIRQSVMVIPLSASLLQLTEKNEEMSCDRKLCQHLSNVKKS